MLYFLLFSFFLFLRESGRERPAKQAKGKNGTGPEPGGTTVATKPVGCGRLACRVLSNAKAYGAGLRRARYTPRRPSADRRGGRGKTDATRPDLHRRASTTLTSDHGMIGQRAACSVLLCGFIVELSGWSKRGRSRLPCGYACEATHWLPRCGWTRVTGQELNQTRQPGPVFSVAFFYHHQLAVVCRPSSPLPLCAKVLAVFQASSGDRVA